MTRKWWQRGGEKSEGERPRLVEKERSKTVQPDELERLFGTSKSAKAGEPYSISDEARRDPRYVYIFRCIEQALAFIPKKTKYDFDRLQEADVSISSSKHGLEILLEAGSRYEELAAVGKCPDHILHAKVFRQENRKYIDIYFNSESFKGFDLPDILFIDRIRFLYPSDGAVGEKNSSETFSLSSMELLREDENIRVAPSTAPKEVEEKGLKKPFEEKVDHKPRWAEENRPTKTLSVRVSPQLKNAIEDAVQRSGFPDRMTWLRHAIDRQLSTASREPVEFPDYKSVNKINVRLDPDVIDEIDARRGSVPRTEWIKRVAYWAAVSGPAPAIDNEL